MLRTRSRSHARTAVLLLSSVVANGAVALAQAPLAHAQPPPQAQPADDARRNEAKAHFLRGVEHTERAEWDAAVSEFLRSREILPTSTNTYNAAVALRKANRFDESLEMYEALLREFPEIPAAEKQVAARELEQLQTSIGTITVEDAVPRAKIVVDGRERGTFPLAAPIRIGAGSHTVRVSADGYLPFETKIDVAGGKTTTVKPTLAALTAAGRLSVTEQTGRALDVVVDNAAVGKTPWEGALAPGEHTVFLRGDGNVGTQPVRPNISLDQVVSLNLLAEKLDASVRIEPTPATSTVAIDGVVLGRGPWAGRLRAGTHEVSATAEGFLPWKRSVSLGKDAAQNVPVPLERDPNYLSGPKPKLVMELDSALPLGLAFGGEVSDACSGGCSAGLPFGLHAVVHGTYQLGSGFGFGIDAGYLLTVRSIRDADATLQPKGRAANVGKTDDALRLSGVTLGAAAQYHRGEEWPITIRLGAGVVLGSMNDSRSGTFTNSTSERYTVDVSESAPATYLYVAPEVRIGRYVTKNLELNLGAELLLMTALAQPSWRDQTAVVTSNVARGDGIATFGSRTTTGSFLFLFAPGIGARYTF
ncbi:MAG: PEGA domain-containing protein [Deltaproteobacteria bacterium]|nr:PEGA domain-containing protein [Deltaproteobacteria bacterium]